MKAVILAGGRGGRFEPYTIDHPKAIYPVLYHPMITRVLDTLPDTISEIIITLNYKGEEVIAVVGDEYNGKKVSYVWQDPNTKGTWPAVYATRNFFKDHEELFLMIACDDIFNTIEIENAIKQKVPLFGIHKKILPAKYHGMRLDSEGNIVSFERHLNENREELVEDVFACGLYILPAKIFTFEPKQLIDGEYGLPQTLLARYENFKMKSIVISQWFGLNTPAEVVVFEEYLLKHGHQIDVPITKRHWDTVIINESHEPLTEVCESEKMIFAKNIQTILDHSPYILRDSVVTMLNKASQNLPDGYNLVIIDTVRPLERQQNNWDKKFEEFSQKHPYETKEQIEARVGLVVARPNRFANHNCGGAVDVCLCDQYNNIVDCGYLPQDIKEMEFVKMFSSHISDEQKTNRKILRDAMTNAGFVYYPGEWWHYCYGDRMWAVYTKRSTCQYGPIQDII